MRKIVSILVCMLLITIIFSNGIGSTADPDSTADPKTWIVDNEDDGDFETIQAAVSYATSGDTILVYSGTYYEYIFIETPRLSIIGIDEEYKTGDDTGKPIIDGDKDIDGDVVDIKSSADETTISGFIIQNAGDQWYPPPRYDSGIRIRSDDNTITHNFIRNCPLIGICIDNEPCVYTENQNICYNLFSNNYRHLGLYWCSNSIVRGNKFLDIFENGISSVDSTNIEVVGCTFNAGLDAHEAFKARDYDLISSNFQIHRCSFSEMQYGIQLTHYAGEGYGIYNFSVYDCSFYDWSRSSIALETTYVWDCQFYHNNFYYIDGWYVAYDDGIDNIWDYGYPSGGNYWNVFDEPGEKAFDDYWGENQNREGEDGIVDKGEVAGGGLNPYNIYGTADAQDIYPSIEEYDWNNPSNTPSISGPTNGKAGKKYEYTFVTTDPEEDALYYYIDWGDETNTGWIGLYSSGEEVKLKHSWGEKRDYTIKAKSKDIFDEESDWAYLEISMPVYVGEGCPEGTQINMFATSETENIEDVRAGDYIQSYDPLNQVVIPARVVEVYEFTVDLPEYYLVFNDNLEVTPSHTLYINGSGWMKASDAQIGNRMLENPPGTSVIYLTPISSKVEEPLGSFISIYDLEIQPLSSEASGYWANSILVGGYN